MAWPMAVFKGNVCVKTDNRVEVERTRPEHENGMPRHISIDEHGWFQKNARDTLATTAQPMFGRERLDGIR